MSRLKLILVKGSNIQIGDIFNRQLITYCHNNGHCTNVRFHNNQRDYFLNDADVIVQRAHRPGPVVIEQVTP